MKHSPGFLQLVERVRRRVRECKPAEVKAKLDRGEMFHFIDVREDHEFAQDHATGARHLGKGVIERDIETVVPEKWTTSYSTAEAGFGPYWPPMPCNRWGTPTWYRWRAGSEPGERRAIRRNSRPACRLDVTYSSGRTL